ncbi:helix-turn-helix domain-containing protein [Streptomyces sp. NBC_01477]|uniref:helix-turn-helix domain-containing protein n=1 Tax=Streptomyces sp. NBC_01477 TaxID=2976015 RepID=UPI002E33105D|nr:helix-turn-helix domain-containing protein [Streptomyces sp. NBC_01477]
MPATPTPIALLADALGVSEQDLRQALHASTSTAYDPTLVALTVEEAARRLSVGRTTMYALLASGEIPSVAVGRLRRIPAEALNDYLAARTPLTRSTVALAA